MVHHSGTTSNPLSRAEVKYCLNLGKMVIRLKGDDVGYTARDKMVIAALGLVIGGALIAFMVIRRKR